MKNKVQIARKFFFSAAHNYWREELSEEENKKLYGGATQVHGHDYTVTCTLEGPIDPISGLVVNLVDVDKILKEVLGPLDQRPLNESLPEFQSQVPSAENLALYFFERLKKYWPAGEAVELTQVRVAENDDLWAEYPAL